jgi:multidrug efflux pump subunit AcrB
VTKQTPDGIEAQAGFKTVIPPKNVLSTFNESTLDSKKFNLIPVGPAPSGEAMGFNGLFFISENIDHDKMTKLWNTFCDNEHIDTCLKQEHYFKTDARLRPRHLGSAMMGVTSLHSASQIFLPINQVDLSLLGNLDTDEVLNLNIPSRVNLLENSLEVKGGWATSIGSHYDTVFDRSKTLIMRLNGTEFRSLFFRLKDYTLGAADFLLSRIRRNLDVHSSAIIGRGELENMNETFAGMIKSLIISTFIVFLILVVQFKSVAQTLVIMGTIPLTLGGAVAGLIIMGETVNASVLVGFILLIGIVVNNGIFLVEATNQHLTAGKKGHEAVKTAVQERTRPILMTSFSTIFGMFPVLLLGGEGSELYRGMAIVNVFGMVAGTFLSLVVTPLFIEYLSIPKNMRD